MTMDEDDDNSTEHRSGDQERVKTTNKIVERTPSERIQCALWFAAAVAIICILYRLGSALHTSAQGTVRNELDRMRDLLVDTGEG